MVHYPYVVGGLRALVGHGDDKGELITRVEAIAIGIDGFVHDQIGNILGDKTGVDVQNGHVFPYRDNAGAAAVGIRVRIQVAV